MTALRMAWHLLPVVLVLLLATQIKLPHQMLKGTALLHLGKMSLLLAQNLPHSVKKRKRFQGRLLQQVILRKPDRDTLQTPAGL
ncbi:hypothetical protein ACVFLX_005722, partial [Escherichia coli]